MENCFETPETSYINFFSCEEDCADEPNRVGPVKHYRVGPVKHTTPTDLFGSTWLTLCKHKLLQLIESVI